MIDSLAIDEFPYSSSLDFEDLVHRLNHQKGCDDTSFHHLSEKIEDVNNYLTSKAENLSIFSDPIFDKKLVSLLSETLLPKVGAEPMLSAHLPFQLPSLFQSTTFYQNIGRYLDSESSNEPAFKTMLQSRIIFAGTEILRQIYGIELGRNPGFQRIIVDEFKHKHAYQIVFDSSLMIVRCKNNQAPKLNEAALDELRNDYQNISRWLELLPPEHFSFSGIMLTKATDITVEYHLSDLRNQLLQNQVLRDDNAFSRLQETIKSMLHKPNIRIGVVPYNTSRNRFTEDNVGKWRGLIDRKILNEAHAATLEKSLFCKALNSQSSSYITCLIKHRTPSAVESAFVSAGYYSVLIAPLNMGDEFLGFFEIASPESNGIDPFDLPIIEQIAPLFALVMKRDRDQLTMQLQSIIKENCSILHPSLEWRFTKEAKKLLRENAGASYKMKPIYFPEVYPLYAAADIRGSSTERNNAIRADLTEHLTRAKDCLLKALKRQYVPIVDELVFKVDQQLTRLSENLDSSDEVDITHFLKSRLNDGILLLVSRNLITETEAKDFFSYLDHEHLVVYSRRREFEDAIKTINDSIATLVDEEQKYAQKIFPHYFEKFKTDGVDYNMYIGGSITANGVFNKEYLSNFRLWQLLVACKIEGLTITKFASLPLRLSLTHLILVHSSPMTIRFNPDEKKFDVEGAYNIRYEIIKKRIDKATVKGSQERITQAGKLTVVYSTDTERIEYENYFRFLNSKGVLKDVIEHLDLEELPGASGLHALRVAFDEKFFQENSRFEKTFLNTSNLVPNL